MSKRMTTEKAKQENSFEPIEEDSGGARQELSVKELHRTKHFMQQELEDLQWSLENVDEIMDRFEDRPLNTREDLEPAIAQLTADIEGIARSCLLYTSP